MDILGTYALGAPLSVIGISHSCLSPIAGFSFVASLLCFIWHEDLHNHLKGGCTNWEPIKCVYMLALRSSYCFPHMYDQESLSMLW
jgi:hypothetical protein